MPSGIILLENNFISKEDTNICLLRILYLYQGSRYKSFLYKKTKPNNNIGSRSITLRSIMCSVSNQSPVQLQLALELASPSSADIESFQPRLKMAPPLIKIKRYSHKSLHSVVPTILINQKDNQKSTTNLSNAHSKKSVKLRSKHTLNTSSSLDTSFMSYDENVDHIKTDSCCRNSLISPLPKSKLCKISSYRQPSDTDELLRMVSVQLMLAQSDELGKKCDKPKNWFDGQRSINRSSIESTKLSGDNDTLPTSDDGGQFSGASTPDQPGNGTCNVIDEEQLRSACELIVQQQRKAWVAFKKTKKNGHCSLSRSVDKKEIPLSNISSEVINTRCKADTLLSKVNNCKEEGNISSEQFDSGHGSSEEHEITSKVDRFPSAGNTNMLLPISRPYYRYHIRRQKGLKLQNANKIRNLVPSPLGMEMRTIETNSTESKEMTEFKSSSCITRNSQSTVSNIELLDEPNSTSSSSQSSSYLSSRVCSGHASYFSSSSSSVVDIHQLTASCCHPELQESACTVPGCTKEPLLNCGSLEKGHKLPKLTVKATEEIDQLSFTTDPSLLHTLKNTSKKENKTRVKLHTTLTRSCISCGFFTSACSKISQIRRTISGKASSALLSTRSPRK